jgi:patatin-like phospholipase/acyl hydrolase
MKSFESLTSRFKRPGPKRVLSLDGGGIRGMISLAYLQRIEDILKNRTQKENYRLCDYFDLIGGTSTGAIIAAALACGFTVQEITRLYLNLGTEIFAARNGVFGFYLKNKYDATPLERELLNLFGDIKIGDEGQNGLKTGLCIITKRLDTYSTWPVTNHPDDIYFQRNQFLLRDLIRASTAAPTYFSPELIGLGQEEVGTFVDGGLSMMNNPALQMYFIATLKGYPFGWEKGADVLKIVSIGTGRRNARLNTTANTNPNVLEFAHLAPEQLLHDAAELVEIMMQYFSDSPTARVIDKKFGNLEGEIAGNEASFSYLRYNIDLQPETLHALGFPNITELEIENLMQLDQAENKHTLHRIGRQSANAIIQESHFNPTFDVH